MAASKTGFDVIEVLGWSWNESEAMTGTFYPGLPSSMVLRCRKCGSEWQARTARAGAPIGLGYFRRATGSGLTVRCIKPGCGAEIIPAGDLPKS
jgi:hypothetical protein